MLELDCLSVAINLGRADRQDGVDLLILIPGFRLKIEPLFRQLAFHIGLGQRRALIGQRSFFADQGDIPFKPKQAQRRAGLRRGLTAANNHDTL